jgi:hypothetical protein
MNTSSTNTGGWAQSAMRTYLQNDIWGLFPADLKEAIVEVDKTYRDGKQSGGMMLTCSDKVWIPSAREVFCGSSMESSGAMYDELFTSNTDRKRKRSGVNIYDPWWLRSADNSQTNFCNVSNSGAFATNNAYEHACVVIGFCT